MMEIEVIYPEDSEPPECFSRQHGYKSSWSGGFDGRAVLESSGCRIRSPRGKISITVGYSFHVKGDVLRYYGPFLREELFVISLHSKLLNYKTSV